MLASRGPAGPHLIICVSRLIRMTPSETAGGTAMLCAILGMLGQLAGRSKVGMEDAVDLLVRKLKHHGGSTPLVFRRTI
jgi:hypothetical protein